MMARLISDMACREERDHGSEWIDWKRKRARMSSALLEVIMMAGSPRSEISRKATTSLKSIRPFTAVSLKQLADLQGNLYSLAEKLSQSIQSPLYWEYKVVLQDTHRDLRECQGYVGYVQYYTTIHYSWYPFGTPQRK